MNFDGYGSPYENTDNKYLSRTTVYQADRSASQILS